MDENHHNDMEQYCALKHAVFQQQMDALAEKIAAQERALNDLRIPLNEVTAGVRALRWLGIIVMAIAVLMKTGDIGAALGVLSGAGE